jgi:RND family efflux transporter MFP subunit
MDMPTNKDDMLSQLRIDRSAPGEPTISRRTWTIASLALVVLVVAGVAARMLLSREPQGAVRLATAHSLASGPSGASVLDASGYVTARRVATVSSKITGKVKEVLIEEGQHVKDGQVLATLDDTEARAARQLQAAQLEQSRRQLAEIRALLANAERELVRQQRTAAQKLTSESALDAAATSVETYRARLASAESAVQVAADSLKVADVQLDNTIVRAPFAGVIVVKAAQPGEMISPVSAGGGFTRTGIGTIVDMDSLEVEVDVNESYINRVQPGQPVEALLNAYPDWKIPASVIAIIPAADRSKATVKVRVALGVKDPRIVPDMGVRVSFMNERKPEGTQAAAPAGVLVPAEAVSTRDGAPVVFVFSSDKVERRSVQLGQTFGAQRQILSGLREGERVVLEPADDLEDGDSVAPAEK